MNEETLFAEAVAIESPIERAKFLDEACAGNAGLRTAVDRLLALHDSAHSFLEQPPAEVAAVAAVAQGDPAATILHGSGSTTDDEDATFAGPAMSDNPDDETPLGYLLPSSQPDSLGRLGHYEILEVVGRGAFGTVLRAFDEKLQRVVAIKVLAPEMAATSPARKRFLREARTSAAIRHENVVAIHAVEDEPIPYLVMEYIPGQTLQKRLDAHGPLDLADVLRLGKQIADGLAAAHAQGLIHRDIKPGNILLEGGMNDRVKITDFGLARTADDASMTQSGLIAGTPMYMAPEQALGQKLDQRADLFSFGSVLYQMLSGRPPFRAANTVAVLKRVVEDTPRPIPEIIPEVPDWICQLIGHLHAKQPEGRYQTAQEVSELLGRCLDDLKVGRTPTIPGPHLATAPEVSTPSEPGLTAPDAIAPDRAGTARLSRKRPWPKVAAVALLLLIGLTVTEATGVTQLTSTVIRLSTGSGTLVIETDDPGVKIAINGEEVNIQGAGVEQLTLKPGQYTIAAMKDGEPVSQQLVTITRGGKEIVRVSLERPSERPTWGTFINPLQDCKLRTTPAGISLSVPGNALHDLNPTDEWNNFDAPRLLRTVEGDFILQVKVLPFPRSQPGTAVRKGFSYRAAGLLVWDHGGTLLRHELASAGEIKDGKPHLQSEWFDEGEQVDLNYVPVVEGPIFLQVERHHDRLSLRWSDDGKVWHNSEDVDDLTLSPRLQIGVVAINATSTPLEAVFEDLRIEAGTPDAVSPYAPDNYALAFDGKSYVATPVIVPLDGPFTVETWANPSRWDNAELFSVICNAERAGISLELRQFETLNWGFSVQDQRGYQKALSTSPPEKDRFVHLAGVFDGAQARLFVNGKLMETEPALNLPLKPSSLPLMFGANPQPDGKRPLYFFSGMIDEVRISGVARYSGDFTPASRFETDQQTLALYHFDEGAGDVLKDSSGNGHHGKIVGATWVKADVLPPATPETATSQPIDLIALLDPTRDFLDSRLKLQDGKLITPPYKEAHRAIGMIPYGPVPEDYDIELRLQRLSTRGPGFKMGLLVGGQQVALGMDSGVSERVWGLEFLDGVPAHLANNPTRNPGGRLPIGKTCDVTIQVRKNHITASCDGETLIDWTGDPERLSLWKEVRLPRSDALFFLAQADFVVHKMTLIPRGVATGQKATTAPHQWPADAPPPATAPKDDWQPLFNGRDLTGWKTLSELPGQWEVKDGVLTGRAKPSFLFSERGDLANFHLRAEIKVNGWGDAGLWFRAPYKFRHGPQAWMVQPATGYEAELSDQPQPLGTLWQVYGEVPPQLLAAAATTPDHPAGEWFTLEVVADGNHLVTKVNGHEAVNIRDKFNRFSVGHLVLAVTHPQTVLEVRKLDVRELPLVSTSPTVHEYASGEWIDVIPLIDPQRDKWDMRSTGRNDWRIEHGELIAVADDKPSKLLLPLDADGWRAFECELDFTRRSGALGFNLNFPAGTGDTPLAFDPDNLPGVYVRLPRTGRAPLTAVPQITTGQRTTLRIEVRPTKDGDRITVWNNGTPDGAWTGQRNQLVSINNEGYPHARRLSLWIFGERCEYVFHRLRVRTFDGHTADALRLPPAAPASAISPVNVPPTTDGGT